MNNLEFAIYCGQFTVLILGFIFLEKKFKFLPISLVQAFILLISSIFLSAFTAHIAELDSKKYLNDAILLKSFLDKDKSLYGLFFLSGGNSIYPQHYFPMLIASNTWSNYTSFTIEKFYLFFSLISKPNLFNVSLFFGLLSFISKGLLLKTLYHLDRDRFKLNVLYGFLLIGGIEVIFVSGVYKENLLLFFISFIIYTVYSPRRTWKYLIALLCFINALFIRLDTVIIMLVIGLGVYLFDQYKSYGYRRYLLSILLVSIPLFALYFSPYKNYVVNKLTRYSNLRPGNTNFDFIDWNSNFGTLLPQILWRWRQAFYSFCMSSNSLIALNFLGLASWCFIAFLLYHQTKRWNRIALFTTSVFIAFILTISLVVPNYTALLRYRSPLLVLFVFGLVLNINKKTI
jgi:hypothetical protein